jgi:hypothetical protein
MRRRDLAALHEDFAREQGIRGGSDRSFGVIFGIFLSFLGLWPLRVGHPARAGTLILGSAFLLTAVVRPDLLRPLNRVWTEFGFLLSRVASPIFAGLLFFMVFTPVGLVSRCLGKDPLRLFWQAEVQTYWILRQPPGPPPATISNQY